MRNNISLIVFNKMVKLNLVTILLVCFCLICSSCFQLYQQTEADVQETLAYKSVKLGFGNITGPGTTAEQVDSFINFINSASIYFRDDNKSRLDYISDQMNKTYGIPGYGFSVIQQGQSEFENWGSWLISPTTDVYASVNSRVDKIFPYNSYMFIQEPIKAKERSFFETSGQKGSGINSTFQAFIKNTIMTIQDRQDFCWCDYMEKIINEIQDYAGGNWNIICSINKRLFKMNVYAKDGKYIYTGPINCYYGIYLFQ